MSRRKLTQFTDAEKKALVAREFAPDTGDLARGNTTSYGTAEPPRRTWVTDALEEE